jgi:hypothetical protein
MIPDLLLALASVAVLLSPFPLDAWRGHEFRKREEAKQALWSDQVLHARRERFAVPAK